MSEDKEMMPPHYVTGGADVYLVDAAGRKVLVLSTNPASNWLSRITQASKIAYLLNKEKA